uniref:BTB domain-containing protein n=1 Tax=Aegilops tauschii subsp. strangulata TaxID=200361 RepID=A0A452ZX19_AEGTS
LHKSKHLLKDDCFTIRCDFIIAEAAAAAPLIEVPPSSISEHLNHLFVTKVGADVTFEVGHETFAAHRCLLASRSPVFMAELFGPMKEGVATAGAIQIQDMEPNVFKALLSFLKLSHCMHWYQTITCKLYCIVPPAEWLPTWHI